MARLGVAAAAGLRIVACVGLARVLNLAEALTVERARDRALGVHLLPVWFDVDTEPDLRRLHAEMATGRGWAGTDLRLHTRPLSERRLGGRAPLS